MLTVKVIDNGIGIKPEDYEKLFTLFGKFNEELAYQSNGFGLGLYVSQQIIENCGGKISIDKDYDEGSAFTFTLPACILSEIPTLQTSQYR